MTRKENPDRTEPEAAATVQPPGAPETAEWRAVAAWRKETRARLIAERLAVPAARRESLTAAIADGLDTVLGDVAGRTISFYWPFRGEPDLRPWATAALEKGAALALPVVVEKARPLVFRPWRPSIAMTRGVWNIPIPEAGPEILPDILIAPLVGFDAARYRLGYGGGFFDRTLAAHPGAPLVIGVGYAQQRLPTIQPQPHDVPMSRIVTETGPL